MRPELSQLLIAVDSYMPPLFSFDDLEQWPQSILDGFVASGLLQPTSPATHLTCFECGATEQVIMLQNSVTRELEPYLNCRELGFAKISRERLLRWQVSYTAFLRVAFSAIDLSGDVEELVKDRVWKVGHAYWAGAVRHVYFARGLHRGDACQVMTQANLAERSIVFVPARVPTETEEVPIVLPLTSYLRWENDGLRFDRAFVESEIAVAVRKLDERDAMRPKHAKRGSRVSIIERLTEELKDHLKAARDFAIDALDRLGEPQLLPRPQKDFLARKLGVHKSKVTRAFQDESAKELCFLWEMASDLDRIMRRASFGS